MYVTSRTVTSRFGILEILLSVVDDMDAASADVLINIQYIDNNSVLVGSIDLTQTNMNLLQYHKIPFEQLVT